MDPLIADPGARVGVEGGTAPCPNTRAIPEWGKRGGAAHRHRGPLKKQLSEKPFLQTATGHKPLGKNKRNHNHRTAEPPTHRSCRTARYLYYMSTLQVWEGGLGGPGGGGGGGFQGKRDIETKSEKPSEQCLLVTEKQRKRKETKQRINKKTTNIENKGNTT